MNSPLLLVAVIIMELYIGRLVLIHHNKIQNGVSERKHKHLTEMALTLLAKSSMPLKYWDDAIRTSVYLVNCLPSHSLSLKSPFEILFHSPPNYSTLKVFGWLCFPYTRPFQSVKFSFKSIPCVFLGYCPGYKGFKCVDLKTNKV